MESCKHTQKDLISCMKDSNAGAGLTLKRAMLRLLRWRIQKIIVMTLIALRWLSYGVVVAWLVLGYSILPLLYYAAIENLASSMEEYQTVVRVVGLFTVLWISVFQAPVITTALFSRFESRRLGRFANKVLNGMRAMFGGHDVR